MHHFCYGLNLYLYLVLVLTYILLYVIVRLGQKLG